MQFTFLICYSVLVSFALAMLFWIIPNQTEMSFGYGLPPETYPNVVTTVLFFASLYLLIQEIIKLYKINKENKEKALKGEVEAFEKIIYFPKKRIIHLFLCLIVLYSTFPLITKFGFIPVSFCSVFILQFLGGGRSYISMLIVSIGMALAGYFALQFLGIPLPV